MSKVIFRFYNYQAPNEKVMAWVRANNLDPHLIPVDSQAVIEGGKLTVTEIKGVQAIDGSGMERATRTVPLLSPLSEHGL